MSDDRLDELDEAQRAWALELRASLRASERVDSATASRLAEARANAIANGGSASRPRWVWASGGLTAAAIVAALLLVQTGGLSRWSGDSLEAGADSSTADAMEVLTDDLDSEFYEDLDLYRWLAEDGRA